MGVLMLPFLTPGLVYTSSLLLVWSEEAAEHLLVLAGLKVVLPVRLDLRCGRLVVRIETTCSQQNRNM
jgi:hypothetical protein